MNNIQQLQKVMKPEYYKGFQLRQIDTNRWQFGIKTFDSKEDLKKFIDKIHDCKIILKQ
jgi:hypothetical protein